MKKISIIIFVTLIILGSCAKENDLDKEENIEKQDPIIEWANPDDIYYETLLSELQLNATASVPGHFSYNPDFKTKLEIGNNQLLEVYFQPTDYTLYNGTRKQVYINVLSKKNPVITWENPIPILFGTLLTEQQLNAQSDIEGTFIYSPDFNKKLYPYKGHKLTLIFTPNNTVEYNTVYDTVKLDVAWDEIVFNENVTYGTMTDHEGNVYKTITVGSQTWMAENLRVTTYRNGDPIPNLENYDDWKATSEGAFCWLNNDPETNMDIFGALYNWYSVMDERNIAPEGWHVPTTSEWFALTGGSSSAGIAFKEVGTKHWKEPNDGVTNSTGMTILPAGCRNTGGSFVGFADYTYSAEFWTVNEVDVEYAYVKEFKYYDNYAGNVWSTKTSGHPVRLVKD
ncbi:MAG: fibrobacter succinogenes major paralogous domain-containing protein [Bacteroidales bacterium]